VTEWSRRVALGGLLVLAFVTRAAGPGQPIVENYVGRQVPTAMVARNLERGSGFLRPSLDVAPLPNLFLVEPPVYEAVVVGFRRVTGMGLETAGRWVSALGIVLGAWGLYGLVARRDGPAVGLAAVAGFVGFPVTVRYGRAFQPDALMLGLLLAGLRCWDGESAAGRSLGRVLVAAGLALKVISAYVVIPAVVVLRREGRPRAVALGLATLVPALLWYAYAGALLAGGGATGSRASADNGGVWLRVLNPTALSRPGTYFNIIRSLCVRAFTPVGGAVAMLGFVAVRDGGGRLWRVWGVSALATLAALAAKLHHEYYWLALAPAAAAGFGRGLVWLARWGRSGRRAALGCGLAFLAMAAALSASTYRTPPEWAGLGEAARAVREVVPAGDWVVAPEALLYYADRRGCRLELTAAAAGRAAGEWGADLGGGGPTALVEFYRMKGARYFADVVPEPPGPARLALHEAIRRRYNVLRDRPGGVLLAELPPAARDQGAPHGTGIPADAEAQDLRPRGR